jgi:hypothetical protein
MKLPNYIIAGAQKSGTTTLHSLLSMHPNIFMPDVKEVGFFNNSAFFKDASQSVIGEASPDYMWEKEAAKRIYDYLPRVKIIFILRNPVERAYSSYWHAVRYGRESLSFEDALDSEAERMGRSYLYKQYNSYLGRGNYAEQIERFLQYFKRENIYIETFENYSKLPLESLSNIVMFICDGVVTKTMTDKLGIKYNQAQVPRSIILQQIRPSLENIHPKCANAFDRLNLKKEKYPEMNKQTRSNLEKYFRPMKSDLESLLNRSINEWNF